MFRSSKDIWQRHAGRQTLLLRLKKLSEWRNTVLGCVLIAGFAFLYTRDTVKISKDFDAAATLILTALTAREAKKAWKITRNQLNYD